MCVCVGLVLISNGDMGACLPVADQQWTHGCALVGSSFNNSHMGVCLLFADQQLRHVCAGLVLISNGDMDVCFYVADQQWTHGLVLGWC